MVLSIIIATIAAPGLLGSQEAIRQSQSKEKREEHRARRCNLIATCLKSSIRSREINGRPIVLRNGKLWVDTGTDDGSPFGHPYAGYYLPYPDSKYEGLVTTITDIAPIMNWIYIDKDTLEVKYGVRADAQPNLTGPFDCTRQDRRLTFDGWEGWCAVEEFPGLWALYFDLNDNGLQAKIASGTRVLEVELSRKEKRFQKEPSARQQDQTTKRAVDAKEDAPVDQPLGAEEPAQKLETETTQADTESTAPKFAESLRMPRSIFDDPPPMVESLPFGPQLKPFENPRSIFTNSQAPEDLRPEGIATPRTPPPAYTSNARPAEALKSPISISVEESFHRSSLSLVSKQDGKEIVAKPFTNADNIPLKSNRTPSPTNMANRRSSSPLQPLQVGSLNEKRTTPKLNRNSGTRALAQAQKFEAMAAAQRSTETVQRSNSARGSRASSNADSTSGYSNDGQNSNSEIGPNAKSLPPQTPPKPAPLVFTQSKTKSPILQPQAEVSIPPVRRDENLILPLKAPTRQQAQSRFNDPAVFGGTSSKNPEVSSPPRRVNAPRALPARGSSSQQSPSRSSNQRPTTNRLRRDANYRPPSPDSNSLRGSSSPPIRMIKGSARKSLAATMTTGRSNQGMTNRIVSNGARNTSASSRTGTDLNTVRAANGRKTTSALFREIDELVSQDIGDSKNDVGNVALRRAETMPITRLTNELSKSNLKRLDTKKNNTRDAEGQAARRIYQ